ncbi:GHKL domain-containing protein [Clostridioides difficile]|nr:GHKL domain-containing protein [Clostridioides difficile]
MLSIVWKIINLISTSIDWIILKYLLDKLDMSKKSETITLLNLIASIIIIFILNVIQTNENLKLLINIFLAIFFYKYNYQVSLIKSVFASLIFYMVFMGLDTISSGIIILINQNSDFNVLLHNTYQRLELILLTKALLFIIVYFIKFKNFSLSINKKDTINIIIPIVANVGSFIVIFFLVFKDQKFNFQESVVIFLISIILMMSNISIIVVISKVIRLNRLEVENSIMKNNINIQYKYYSSLVSYQKKIRHLHHDINNHINTLKSLPNDCEIYEEYVKNLEERVLENQYIYNTGNIVIDAILREKHNKCSVENINLSIDIKLNEELFIKPDDICIIFANIIDNAIEACSKANEGMIKYIKLRATLVNKFYVIKCENSRFNEVKINNLKITTDKKDKFFHGIGLSSVRYSVEKYNGYIKINTPNDKFEILIYIPIGKLSS